MVVTLPLVFMALMAAVFLCLGLRMLQDVHRVRRGDQLQDPLLYRAIIQYLTWRTVPEPTPGEIVRLMGIFLALLGGLCVVTMIAILIHAT